MNNHHCTIIYRLSKPINQTAEFHSFHIVLHLHYHYTITAAVLTKQDNFRSALSRSFLVYIFSSINRCLYCSQRHFSHASFTCLCSFGICIPDSFLQLVLLHLRKPCNSQISKPLSQVLLSFCCSFIEAVSINYLLLLLRVLQPFVVVFGVT